MKEEYYHIGSNNEGESGPFDTLEAAQADALEYLHGRRWCINEIKILKVVATSRTETKHTTVWENT